MLVRENMLPFKPYEVLFEQLSRLAPMEMIVHEPLFDLETGRRADVAPGSRVEVSEVTYEGPADGICCIVTLPPGARNAPSEPILVPITMLDPPEGTPAAAFVDTYRERRKEGEKFREVLAKDREESDPSRNGS